jgi:hypothetical protein
MTGKNVLILGGEFGGLSAAQQPRLLVYMERPSKRFLKERREIERERLEVPV